MRQRLVLPSLQSAHSPTVHSPPFKSHTAAMAEQAPHKRARKRKADTVAADLPPEEADRRKRQKYLQKLALRQRAAGKEYKRPPKPKALSTASHADEEGSRPSGKLQVGWHDRCCLLLPGPDRSQLLPRL